MGIENAKIHYHYQPTNTRHDRGVRSRIEISTGALAINTGEFIGKVPSRSIYRKDSLTEKEVWWGKVNIPLSQKHLMLCIKKVTAYLSNKEVSLGTLMYVCRP
jgi:phosphoenolpyruvate carboxykinase (ATP)